MAMNSAKRLATNSTRKIQRDQKPRRLVRKLSSLRRVRGVIRRPRNVSPAGGKTCPGMRAGVTSPTASLRSSAVAAFASALTSSAGGRSFIAAWAPRVLRDTPLRGAPQDDEVLCIALQFTVILRRPRSGRLEGRPTSVRAPLGPVAYFAWTGTSRGRAPRLLPPRYLAAKISAICTAFSAAPFRRLSETTQRLSPFGTVGSRRMRLT